MSKELKPCPFCGNRLSELSSFRYRHYIVVSCDECGAEGPPSKTEKGAAKGWNTRHGEQQAAGEL